MAGLVRVKPGHDGARGDEIRDLPRLTASLAQRVPIHCSNAEIRS
jgi:hypothetical protein